MSILIELSRPRLIRRLKTAIRLGHIMILAPPGYGKTTLLHAFASEWPNTFYLHCTPADIDLSHLQSRLQPHLQSQATILLDDVQYLDNGDETIAWLSEQIEQSTAQFVISGRYLPAHLQMSRQATLMSKNELVFTAAETAALLGTQSSTAWYKRTQGWPLALAVLVHNSQHDKLSPEAVSDADSVLDELLRSMFRDLPADVLRFMQLTAVPLQCTNVLAEGLTGINARRVVDLRTEVARRNLFIEAAETTGASDGFRYHDLVRRFLIGQLSDHVARFEQVVDWQVAHGDLPAAIDNALDGGLYLKAADLMNRIAPRFVMDTGHYRTFQRWVLALDEAALQRYPLLLAQLGKELRELGLTDEAWLHLATALSYAEGLNDPETTARVRLVMGALYIADGDAKRALEVCKPVSQLAGLSADSRRRLYKITANAHYYLSNYESARFWLDEALRLPEREDGLPNVVLRQNLIMTALLPLGDFAEAERQQHLRQAGLKDILVGRIWNALTWGWLHEAMGDWDALAADLDTLQQLESASEHHDQEDTGVLGLRACLHIGRGEFQQAERVLDRATLAVRDNPEQQLSIAQYRAWLARRTGRYADAIRIVEEALAHDWDSPLARGILAIERAMAQLTLDPNTTGDSNPEILEIVRLHARPYLMRFRALLALRCHHADDPHWKHHAQAVLRETQRYDYEYMLIRREPDLGAAFWAMCVAEGTAVEQSVAALKKIGAIDPLTAFLASDQGCAAQRSDAVVRTVQALSAIGKEEAIPSLVDALSAATQPAVQRSIDSAIVSLETAPPPPLEIKLMGEFRLLRGGVPVGLDAWQRPAAMRLFQYFALNAGKTLLRDQIIEDLWPSLDPESARGSLKTTLSGMRKAIEPYLRPKTPARYFTVAGQQYCFNPGQDDIVARTDIAGFVSLLNVTLSQSEDHDVPPLSEALLAALNGWQPLLPELVYESWVLERSEELLDLYLKGCIYVAQAYLAVARLVEAENWATRVVSTAPWHETGYQLQMRALARQGNRTGALKTHEKCVAALQRELGVPASALTDWLAQCLRAGEDI